MEFEWDREKARANERKHRITFGEATTVFRDPLSISFDDPDHSNGEERHLTFGESTLRRLLIVSHTFRGGKVRIIGCRAANPRERRLYENG